MRPVTQEVIDAYLGDDTFDWFSRLADDVDGLSAAYATAVEHVQDWNSLDMEQQLELLGDLETDIEDGFQRIADGQRIEKRQVLELIELYELLHDNVQLEWDVFTATFAMGFFELLRLYIKSVCRRMYNTLKNYESSLKELKSELEKAQSKLTEARIDKAIDIGQLILTVVAPELKLITNITIAVGGLVADEFLGTGGPDGSKIARTAITTLSGPFGKALKWGKEFEALDKTVAIGNSGYDAKNLDEIDTAKLMIKTVKEKIAAVRRNYQLCKKLFPEWYSQLKKLNMQLDAAYAKIKKVSDEASDGRYFLRGEVQRIKYRTPTMWRTEQI